MEIPNDAQQHSPTTTPAPVPVVPGDATGRLIHLGVTATLALVLLVLGGLALAGRLRFASDQDSAATADRTAVSRYQDHARQVLAVCKDRSGRSLIGVARGAGSGSGKVEFDGEYGVDVRKTGSLVRPYVGEIKLRRKMVWDKWDGPGKPDEGWKEVTLSSQYEDGSWKTTDQQIDGAREVSPRDNGKVDAPRWEYRTLDYGQPVVSGSVEELGASGWEVYAVTGGQPYVSASQTTKGAGDATSTTNTVRFAPRVYHLRMQK